MSKTWKLNKKWENWFLSYWNGYFLLWHSFQRQALWFVRFSLYRSIYYPADFLSWAFYVLVASWASLDWMDKLCMLSSKTWLIPCNVLQAMISIGDELLFALFCRPIGLVHFSSWRMEQICNRKSWLSPALWGTLCPDLSRRRKLTIHQSPAVSKQTWNGNLLGALTWVVVISRVINHHSSPKSIEKETE